MSTDLQRICVKFYTTTGEAVDQTPLIDVFQDWIRTDRLDEIMIDIADYRHVPNGPGMMLICHHTDYALDSAEGERLGLLVQRKQPLAGNVADRIVAIAQSGLRFIEALQGDPRVPDGLTFDLSGFEVLSNDRLRVPNTDEGFAAIRGEVEAAAQRLYGDADITIERRANHPRARLAVVVRSSATPVLSDLLAAAAA
ncbi:MAG: hypothetical protein D6761_09830 [Candidatus Dadabacteria bacterium]|nr:MAG: hypothetical protein D6761_09830 [Candidatus Dadabacteria bacterium]